MSLRHFLITFILLIVGTSIGLTGLNYALWNNYGVVQVDQKKILGSYQEIRSDEWGVLTPLCLSQMNHKPAFPVKNETIDVEGKNMLIVHDYGVPVKHISAIARPTTWGYFTGNIRIGMAWNWLFPLFIGFVGISLLLNLLLGVERINMVIALAIVYAPICSSWSNFPLYHLGLGAVAAWSFLQILSSENIKKNILFGLLCGWAASSFALTLYLPRLIPMSWLLIMFSIAIIVKDSLYNNLLKRFPYIILSVLVICILLGFWYVDAKDAIAAMLNSVYPGKRFITGGYFTAWDFVRGWFPFQLVNYYYAPFVTSACDLSSFPNMSFLIVFLLIFGFDKEHFSGSKVPVFLLGSVIVFFYIYQYIGFPSWLASVTFLGKSHPRRLDSSILVAQVFLLSYLAKNCKLDSEDHSRAVVCSISTIVVSGVYLVVSFIYGIPVLANSYLLSQHTEHLIYFFALYVLMVYSYPRNWRKGACLMTILFAVPGFLFNPLSKAPHRVTSNLPAFINVNAGTNHSRVLFITADGGNWQGNSANAVGIASLNGVHHYVDRYMFDHFYRKLQNGEQFNRFNHAMFVLDEKTERFTAVPQGDVIRWKINPLFDFGELPVSYVAVSTGIKLKLLNNNSLKFIEDKKGFSYFRVNKP